ncbi:NAD(P)/FAD-dependent oxidoreductase [Allorhodopirellula heiligendammensis]|uniref:Succinate dehydrogenase n=1 Tax=Allorhodopirellula heiligendammensis TaxID=2714739 RepID=A0A5C6C3R4_9BACT|nr:aminoacetone oxidase family FAD-binding enzyme [Allorhodopirellula heiligendammensis]TWU18725.1 putative succinate dehydrogenase [Allorhodopirellula heiligendammensis]
MAFTTRPRIVVIGAGAAGMMAAAVAARRGGEVIVLEKSSKTGVKILMSGGTRCNLTHDTNARGITTAFGHAARWLQPSVGKWSPSDTIDHFQQLGVATKRESTGKIFPMSNRAIDVRDALHRDMIDAGAVLELRSAVQSVRPGHSGGWTISAQSPHGQHECAADHVIVTAGGQSWPGCGTTGDAYGWLSELGHTIVRTRPALVPLVGGTEATRALSGLTLDDVVAEVHDASKPTSKRPLARRRASWLFTHFGFSGPAAMDVSGTITAASSFRDTRLHLDLIPEISEADLRELFAQRSGPHGKQTVSSLLARWLPTRLAAELARSCGAKAANADKTLAEFSATSVNQVVDHLKRWQLPVHDTRGFAKAEVTAGGVSLADVDPRTMRSRRCPGLFIAGEVLDVDGWIGGYNFQAAFSTGRAAGIAATDGPPD